ncbi:MAG: ABC transporter permease, partial [Pirellulales bacterium]|nr:ABC transporter permease [Pirellulales bacterium]
MKNILSYSLFVAARLGLAAITILGVATLVFFGMKMIPGDYVDLFFPIATVEERAQISIDYGLDKPAFTQYLLWLGNTVQGDFGTSLVTRKPVLSEITQRLPLTFELAALALGFITLVALPLG